MGLKVNQSHTNVIAFALFVEFEIGSNLQADRRHVCVSTVSSFMNDAGLEGVGRMAQPTPLKRSAPRTPVSTDKRAKTDIDTAQLASPAKSPNPDANIKPWIDHLAKHKASDAKGSRVCSKCLYAKNCRNWRQMTTITALKSSWLSPRPVATVDADWGIGCLVCCWAQRRKPNSDGGQNCCNRAAYAFSTVSGPAMRITNFKRHARSADHQAAEAAYVLHVARRDVQSDTVFADAPSLAEFCKVMRDGPLAHKQFGGRKLTTMEWCLFEALRDEELAFLASAVCISLAVDERNGRLLIKYSASNTALDVRVGCLAQVLDPGGSAHEVASAIHTGIDRLCSRRVAHKGMSKVKCSPLTHAAKATAIRARIEMYTADGAANEQLAARILHPASVRNAAGVPKLPSLKMVIRDKAHATRRLTERSFRVDQDLNFIWETLINGHNSIARLLENSRSFKSLFADEVAKQRRCGSAATVQSSITELGFSKDRFDSKQKPLSRCVLNLDALISTALLIYRTRDAGSKEGQGVRSFMNLLNEKNVLLLGMMADASDECLMLTRFFDREAFRIEEMSNQLEAFRRRLQALFAGRVCLRTGHTAIMMQYLRTSKMVHKTDSKMPVSFGGRAPQGSLIDECLGKMIAWCRLVEEVARTEFPDYELLAAFQIFRLQAVTQASRVERLEGHIIITDVQAKFLFQLSTAFGVDATRLPTQFLEHRRIAQDIIDTQPSLPVPQAWQLALQQTQSTNVRRTRFPAEALLSVLARYVVAPGSTSGIEQTFSRFKRVLGEHWQGSEQAEERRLVLDLASASFDDPVRLNDIATAARVVWVISGFGVPRPGATATSRLKMRVSEQRRLAQARVADRKSAASWLLHRRQQVSEAVQLTANPSSVHESVRAAAEAAWSGNHQK